MKQFLKKLCSASLALLLALGCLTGLAAEARADVVKYPVYVQGIQVTSQNKADVLGNNKVSYDPSTKTLTLNNAKIRAEEVPEISEYDETDSAGIWASQSLTVVLKGSNSIDVSTSVNTDYINGICVYGGNLTLKGSGSLSITGESISIDADAIYCEKNVTVDGITLSVKGTANSDYEFYGIFGNRKVTLKDTKTTISLTGPEDGEYTMGNVLGARDELVICGSSVVRCTATGIDQSIIFSDTLVRVQDQARLIAEINTTYPVLRSDLTVSGSASVRLVSKSYAMMQGRLIVEEKGSFEAIGGFAALSDVDLSGITPKPTALVNTKATASGRTAWDGKTALSGEETDSPYKYVHIPGKIQIREATVSGIVSKTYTGKAITQKAKLTENGIVLKAGTDYTVSYKNNVKAGTATVTFTGKGLYTGTLSKTFKINPASITKAKVGSIPAQLYTGKAVTPKPTVKFGTKTLKAGTDFTVSYKNNTRIGKATVTITGKGNFTGKVTATFKIQDPVEAFVTRLYRVCLDRKPEAQGHAWWVARLRAKQETGGSCAWGFFNSTEFKNHKYSNGAFLDHAYKAFFDRKPDTAGKNYWLDQMKKGMTRERVIKSGFAVSNEWKALCKVYGIKP